MEHLPSAAHQFDVTANGHKLTILPQSALQPHRTIIIIIPRNTINSSVL